MPRSSRTSLIPDRCRDLRDFEGLFECAIRAHGLYRIAFKNARATGAERAKVEKIEKAAKRAAGGRIFRQAKGATHRQRKPKGRTKQGQGAWRRSNEKRNRRIVK